MGVHEGIFWLLLKFYFLIFFLPMCYRWSKACLQNCKQVQVFRKKWRLYGLWLTSEGSRVIKGKELGGVNFVAIIRNV